MAITKKQVKIERARDPHERKILIDLEAEIDLGLINGVRQYSQNILRFRKDIREEVIGRYGLAGWKVEYNTEGGYLEIK